MIGNQDGHTSTAMLHGGESMSQTPERLLTPKQVAEILAVSPAWVLDHSTRRRPHLPSVKLGKAVRFRATDVTQFIIECAKMRGAVA
jgi:predicted DNA-binding transcriptional regulator AlpA